jgi:serine phosphatase RsbU (regulator of sigma subunit)
MAELKGAIQANRDLAHSPAELLIQTNNTIYDSLDRATFITMSAMLLDEEKNQLRFSRAGHNSLLKLGCNGEMEEINPPGSVSAWRAAISSTTI